MLSVFSVFYILVSNFQTRQRLLAVGYAFSVLLLARILRPVCVKQTLGRFIEGLVEADVAHVQLFKIFTGLFSHQ